MSAKQVRTRIYARIYRRFTRLAKKLGNKNFKEVLIDNKLFEETLEQALKPFPKEKTKEKKSCYHGISLKRKCKKCEEKQQKKKVYALIQQYPELYPLAPECELCPEEDKRTEKLQHGHIDYDFDGQNYLTVCQQCHYWLDRKAIPHEPMPLTIQILNA